MRLRFQFISLLHYPVPVKVKQFYFCFNSSIYNTSSYKFIQKANFLLLFTISSTRTEERSKVKESKM